MNTLADALIYGVIIACCFPIGALAALKINLGHKFTAAFMSIGAGLLIAAALLDLVHASLEHIEVYQTVSMILIAATVFSGANFLLSKLGAKHRKRCADCKSEMDGNEGESSGLSIALGTVLDAFPEALVLGVTLTGSASALPLVVALGLGNIAQSISSTSGLKASGRSFNQIMMLWTGLAILVILTTMLSFSLLGTMDDGVKPWVEAFAAGILLAMVSEAMLPEAHEKSPAFSGLMSAVGVGVFIIVHEVL